MSAARMGKEDGVSHLRRVAFINCVNHQCFSSKLVNDSAGKGLNIAMDTNTRLYREWSMINCGALCYQ